MKKFNNLHDDIRYIRKVEKLSFAEKYKKAYSIIQLITNHKLIIDAVFKLINIYMDMNPDFEIKFVLKTIKLIKSPKFIQLYRVLVCDKLIEYGRYDDAHGLLIYIHDYEMKMNTLLSLIENNSKDVILYIESIYSIIEEHSKDIDIKQGDLILERIKHIFSKPHFFYNKKNETINKYLIGIEDILINEKRYPHTGSCHPNNTTVKNDFISKITALKMDNFLLVELKSGQYMKILFRKRNYEKDKSWNDKEYEILVNIKSVKKGIVINSSIQLELVELGIEKHIYDDEYFKNIINELGIKIKIEDHTIDLKI